MAKRLVKIAKELNVGTTTIVDHLNNSGFEIENKPTAKITEEMYAELLKEFQKSIAIKEKADQLIIGTRTTATKKEKEKEASLFSTPVREKEALVTRSTKEEANAKSAPPQEKPVEVEHEEVKAQQPRLKVLGKIDLGSRLKSKQSGKEKEEETPKVEPEEQKETPEKVEAKQEKTTEKPVESKEETPPEKEKKETKKKQKEEKDTSQPAPESKKPTVKKEEKEAKQAEEKPDVKEKAKKDAAAPVSKETEKKKKIETQKTAEAKETPVAEKEAETSEKEEPKKEDEVMRAEAPELRGLKILGKIDTDKLKRPKKKKKKEKATADSDSKKAKTKPDASDKDQQSRRRRKRKRKRVPASTERPQSRSNRRQGRGKDRDEVKEVSQKEIDEKIRATMARISGGGKKKRQKIRRESRERIREKQELIEQEKQNDKLQLTEFISVQELANLMDVAVTDVITTCMNLGVIVSINQRLDAEIIELVAEEFGHEVEFISVEEQVEEEEEIIDDPEDLLPRSPIVTVMGHVDHGKTSLLDHIRKANVVEGEAGGITQHIGAYEVAVGAKDKRITFLDTPGHEAFTAMRARGAKVTDIAVIIIAADDSIMPQTREAISHAQAAGVPMVFAINKIDKDGAQPEKIKQELASMNFLVEDWGGKYQSQDISAKSGIGIDELLEKILLEAEMLELQANPDREAIGTVIEASLDKGRGYVAKMLVQTGTLEIGDAMVAGEHSGKVKAMFNERGKRVNQAGPSTAVLVLGLSGAPQAGERFKIVDSEQEARQIASKRAQILREQTARATKRISLDEIGRRLALGTFKELNLIVKGDVDGSIEALSDSLIKLTQETVQVNVIHKAVGQITESDVLLASASDAIVVGFQVRPSAGARKLAEREGVQIKLYSIIYEAIEEVKAAIEGMLEPTKEEKIVSSVEVREIFKISKVGTIAGCYVQEGKITRNTSVRLIRNGIVIFPTKEGQVGEIDSLKRFKDDVKEVRAGMECGISIKNYNDIKVGDVIEGYEIIEIKQTLD